MSYEVDVLAVGEESDSGDAIAMRFGNYMQNPADQKIVVIDGGYKDSGKALVDLIRNTYGSERVDLVVSTHPDNDHVSGLHVVLEELEVGELWMHRPWYMSESIKKLAEENRGFTALGLSNKLKKSLEAAYDLEKLAIKRGVSRIFDPFQGESVFANTLYVLGPSRSYYQSLVADFEKGGTVYSGLIPTLKQVVSEVWHKDELLEPADDATSPRNNSSTILVAAFGGQHFLFTADAGVPALTAAANYALLNNYDLAQRINVLQIPHHGSKRNVGPAILTRLIGPIVAEGQIRTARGAFMSAAAKGEPHHPSRRVTNAIVRRGIKPHATQGKSFYYKSADIPWRPETGPIQGIEFCGTYDETD